MPASPGVPVAWTGLDSPGLIPLNSGSISRPDSTHTMHTFINMIRSSLLAGAILFLPAGAGDLSAQDLSTYYTVTHPEEFDIDWGSFYREMDARTAAVRKQFPHHLDLAFGDDPKQRLDLYLPKGDVSGAPVFLFLHGGGFREGDRAHYGGVAAPFLAEGIITAVASYRLTADGFSYPAQTEDTRNAIRWLHEHVAEYGGNPAALYLGGHSAGAILTADVGVDRQWMADAGVPGNALQGIIPISGPYDLRNRGRAGETDAYAPTAELARQASPVLHVGDPAPAAIVAVGSLEAYQASSRELTAKLAAAGSDASYLLLDGQDHKDTALSLADPESELFQAVLRLIRK